PLSFYLLGPYSGWLVGAYFALAAAILAVAAGAYDALGSPARSALPLLLFALGAVSVCIVALAHTDTSAGELTTTGFVHNFAALAAFLCVSVAMLLQSWNFRRDGRWRPHFARASLLAALNFLSLVVYAMDVLPRGATQKFVILLIVLWLMLAARWLTRVRPAGG
ncbi:MAG TPA: DUF998 domain-containing protein, partial [Gammaproteobacteria bacterium]|nr:DUF998 domain-containing protein [Gammaproteobacteria bacterium]